MTKNNYFFIAIIFILSTFIIGCSSNPTGRGTPIAYYSLTITLTPEGWGTVSVNPTAGKYLNGTSVTLTAIANSGYVFASWEVDAAGTTSPKTITMDSDKNILAVFRTVSTDMYTIEVSVTPEGSGTIEPWGGTYLDGTSVTLTASSFAGCIFDHWEGDLLGAANSIETFTVNGNKNMIAVFKSYWTLRVWVSPEGTGTIEPWGGVFLNGTNVSLTASPDAGYLFKQWSGDITGAINPALITMSSNKNVTAEFIANPWADVGSPYFSDGYATFTSLFVDGSGVPYIAYEDGAHGNKATVQKYSGGSWGEVGSAGFTSSTAEFTSLAVSSGYVPYVAFRDAGNGNKATVMRFNSPNWELVGSVAGFSSGEVSYVSLCLDSSDVPYIAYQDSANGNKLSVMKYSGGAWNYVGGFGFSNATAEYVSLKMSGTTPYAAFRDADAGNKATLMKYSGGWSAEGGTGFSDGDVTFTSLYIDGATPYVAYCDGAHGNKATLMKYSGGWSVVGGAGFSPSQAYYTSLFVSGGVPYVAMRDWNADEKATVMKYSSSAWSVVGGAGFSDDAIYNISIYKYSNIVYAGYIDNSTGKATVKKYNE
jgi:uncharacterized repeat protein (TIGR02543 family)